MQRPDMRGMIAGLSGRYGAGPLHLLVLLACFALAGYAVLRLAANPSLPVMLAWFAGAVVFHDLVLYPLYALADRSLVVLDSSINSAAPHRRLLPKPPPVPVLNHVRVPALAAGLVLLLYFPGVFQLGAPTYAAATGQTQEPFAERWLLLTAAFFAVSALIYAMRTGRAVRGVRRRAGAGPRAPAAEAPNRPGRTTGSAAPARPR